MPDSVSTSHRPASAPEQVGAGVPEHRTFAQVVDAGDERRRREQPERPQRTQVGGADRETRAQQHERLGRAPRAQVEQVEDVGREHEHGGGQQPAAVGEAQVAHREQRQPERADGLERARRELAAQRRRAVTAPAALAARLAASLPSSPEWPLGPPSQLRRGAERVVDQARARARRARRRRSAALVGSTCVEASRCTSRQRDQREQRRGEREHAERERQRAIAVVGARVSAVAERAQQRRREHHRAMSASTKGSGVHGWKLATRADAAQGCEALVGDARQQRVGGRLDAEGAAAPASA